MSLAIADDAIRLNSLLRRRRYEPVEVNVSLELEPLTEKVDDLIDRAWSRRQEILQLALASENAESALKLARLQYAADYTVGCIFNHYRLVSDAPAPNLTQTHTVWVAFNVPLFFWMKQNEDVTRSRYDLEAARERCRCDLSPPDLLEMVQRLRASQPGRAHQLRSYRLRRPHLDADSTQCGLSALASRR